jgi:stringent starvation protein B
MIRAIYEWCNDNGFTPYIAVMVDERTLVPREHVRAGEIVLNLSSSATHRLNLGNDVVEFQARFSGVVRDLSIPVENITAIYARENGHGMAFEVSKPPGQSANDRTAQASPAEQADEASAKPKPTPTPGGRRSAGLSAVKSSSEAGELALTHEPKLASVTSLNPSTDGKAAGKPGKRKPDETPGGASQSATPVAESADPPKQEEVTGEASDVNDTPDPNNEPSSPDSDTGGRSKPRGRAKLTRIK